MAVKAEWFLPELGVDDDDPFGQATPTIVEERGVPIDLSAPTAQLHRELVELLDREAALYNRGVACPIKDRAGTSCHACPIQGRFNDLCGVGLDEERVLSELAAATLHV